MNNVPSSRTSHPQPREWVYLVLVGAALALRLPHLVGPIDNPHSWRQSDTANYALDFYRDGFDLLRPQVCWSGQYSALALEFPLHEALIALLYRLFGVDHLWARLVTLVFFAGSLVYLYRIVALTASRRLAWLTSLVYAALPLSLFYSRAIHIDFGAVFFAHAMLYHFMRGYERGRPAHIVLGAAMGSLGFAAKAPYLFYLYAPLGVYLLHHRPWRKRSPAWLLALAVPVLAFLLWRWNVGQVNGARPDLGIYPTFVDRLEWYFGTLNQRLEPGNWLILLQRLIFDVANPIGTLLLAWGVWGWFRSRNPSPRMFYESWALGAAAYVLIFFNLNWAHSYYQIPLLAIVSVFIAHCLDTFIRMRPPGGPVAALILIALLVGGTLWYAGIAYYRVDWRVVEAGRAIGEHTADDDLVVAYLYDDNFEYTDPRLLYSAQRHGWSIRAQDLTPERIALYAREGGRFLAVVETRPDDRLVPPWLSALDGQQFPLHHDGQSLGTLRLYDLAPLRAASP
ncbi:MAG: glycosyltransferase family 39 protein [Anaerolineae bacterium]|nr:glycosyltransferase family 39 protein [Anaerolineae bacterium]